MAEPFTTAQELGLRLKRTFDTDTTSAVNEMLQDASAYLRDVIGQQVYPQVQATITRRLHCAGRILLPQLPVISVGSATLNETAFTPDPDYLPYVDVCGGGKVKITFTYGYATTPDSLIQWTCVLASQALAAVEELGMIGTGNVASFSIDDYRKAWGSGATNGGTGFDLPQHVIDQLRNAYGMSAYTS